MMLIIKLFSILFLVLSFFGYGLISKEISKMSREFIPVFVFSSVTLIIYLFGLLDLLLIGSIFTLILGLTFFVDHLLQRKKTEKKITFQFTYIGLAFAIGSTMFFSLLLRSNLTHYDNFSHWGIVVKQMLSTNAFPTIDSTLIEFKNYPLGISSFIYYIALFTGKSQAVMIVAQNFLIFACFYALFGIIVAKKRFLLYAILGLGLSTLSVFNITIRINNLLVDFLLPLYALAILVIAYRYKQQPKKAVLGSMPLLALLTIIKSTGIIFAIIAMLFLFFVIIVNRKETSKMLISSLVLLTIFTTAIPYVAWDVHVKNNFSQIENKFDIQNLPSEKTPKQVLDITELFIKSTFDLSTRPTMGILAFNLIALLGIIFNATILKKKLKLWKALLSLNIVLVLYYIGIWAMYIFSMPFDEAVVLAGFERYASSIVVFFAGGLVLSVTTDFEQSFYYQIGDVADEVAFKSIQNKNLYQKGVMAFLAISIALLLSEYSGMSYIKKDYENTLTNKIYEITGDRWYPDGEIDNNKYLFYASDKDAQVTNYYMQYVARYYLYSPNVDGIVLFYEDNMENLLSSYDYLVIVESDFNARYLLETNYGVDGKVGIYKIDKNNNKINLVLQKN